MGVSEILGSRGRGALQASRNPGIAPPEFVVTTPEQLQALELMIKRFLDLALGLRTSQIVQSMMSPIEMNDLHRYAQASLVSLIPILVKSQRTRHLSPADLPAIQAAVYHARNIEANVEQKVFSYYPRGVDSRYMALTHERRRLHDLVDDILELHSKFPLPPGAPASRHQTASRARRDSR